MRTLVAYFSKFGNTRKIADVIAEVMGQAGEVHVVSIEQLTASDFEGVDLVAMGSPTHGFTVPEAVRSILDAQPTGILAGKSVAAFDTTVKPWPLRLMSASPKLLRQLHRLGGKPVAQPQTFFVETRNPQKTGEVNLLLDGEIERARQWANELFHQLKA